jgi:hypothetical protein
MTEFVVDRRYAGPPMSGNGGYVAGLVAGGIKGPATVALRAIIPFDVPLSLTAEGGGFVLTDGAGALIAQAAPADRAALPDPPQPPRLDEARAASLRYPGHERTYHPVCFSCATARAEGDGLRVFAGQLQGASPGTLAASWTPHPAFADEDGTVGPPIVWAALDCPGSYAWLVGEDHFAGLLGTMTCEVLRAPKAGEPHIVMAWPIKGGTGRKRFSGVALYTVAGECLARGRQVWISFPQPA